MAKKRIFGPAIVGMIAMLSVYIIDKKNALTIINQECPISKFNTCAVDDTRKFC